MSARYMQKFIAYIQLTFFKYLMFTFGWAAYPSYQVPEGAQGAFPACQMYTMMIPLVTDKVKVSYLTKYITTYRHQSA